MNCAMLLLFVLFVLFVVNCDAIIIRSKPDPVQVMLEEEEGRLLLAADDACKANGGTGPMWRGEEGVVIPGGCRWQFSKFNFSPFSNASLMQNVVDMRRNAFARRCGRYSPPGWETTPDTSCDELEKMWETPCGPTPWRPCMVDARCGQIVIPPWFPSPLPGSEIDCQAIRDVIAKGRSPRTWTDIILCVGAFTILICS